MDESSESTGGKMNTEFIAEDPSGSRMKCVVVAGSRPQEPKGYAIVNSRTTDAPQQEWAVLED